MNQEKVKENTLFIYSEDKRRAGISRFLKRVSARKQQAGIFL